VPIRKLEKFDLNEINNMIRNGEYNSANFENNPVYHDYVVKSYTPMVGASGAIFGVLTAFAILFPNTELYLYFMFPIKMKYAIALYAAYEIYTGIKQSAGDNVAHFAHLGGLIVGFIIVIFWNKTNRKYFY
jgi:membrane associated rhomboid family serine protease